MLWPQFFICALIIIVSGSRLSLYAGAISEKTGFSAGLMGILVLAVITSFPEIFTSIGAATLVNAPDLAMGDLLGAVIINVLAIAILGMLSAKGSLMAGQSRANIMTAAFTALMLLAVITSIGLRIAGAPPSGALNISAASFILALLYATGIFFIYRGASGGGAGAGARNKIDGALKIKFIASATAIAASGLWLARIGKGISEFYGWGEMSVGIILMAIATTMPEFVVSFAAAKRGSPHMAAGNLLGSNLFNIFIIFILDIFFREGELFSRISPSNILPASLAAVMTGIALYAMFKRPAKEPAARRISPEAGVIIAVFLIGHYIIFKLARAVNW